MKVRSGFVSNSSSSSFVLITDIHSHQKVIDHIKQNSKEGEFLANIINCMVGHKKIGDTELIVFAIGSGEMWENYQLINTFDKLDITGNYPSSDHLALMKATFVQETGTEEEWEQWGKRETTDYYQCLAHDKYREASESIDIPCLTQSIQM